ncbi:hypothetical protein STENM327S_07182 [Streptomyces tendae]
MKLVRLGDPGRERPAVIDDRGVTRDLSPLTPDIDGAFLAADGITRTRRALTEGTLPVLEAEGLRFGPPVARPGAVVCIGQNYAAHAAESGSEPLNTGTPEGVALSGRFPYLRPGEVMEIEIEGLGRQRQTLGAA